jgi:hypothetical protein
MLPQKPPPPPLLILHYLEKAKDPRQPFLFSSLTRLIHFSHLLLSNLPPTPLSPARARACSLSQDVQRLRELRPTSQAVR